MLGKKVMMFKFLCLYKNLVSFSINNSFSGSKLGALGLFPNCFGLLASFIVLKKNLLLIPQNIYMCATLLGY